MKSYFGYIRVSTQRQGVQGSSLQEQKAAIEGYARRYNLAISEWFEELETAAQQGRPVFSKMLKALQQGHASGVITHKIDRSARNLWDWAYLGDLIDQGVEVHFAHENIDLTSRGGRLSADIQAVVAADYIRNLREEVRKGFYGRLKQGIYPLGAPIGYLNQGGGKPKISDPVRAPLVRAAFELYAAGETSLSQLADYLHECGLRTTTGAKVEVNTLAKILHNPFYIGLIRLRGTGEVFAGIHEPIIPTALFERVQEVCSRRGGHQALRHDFLFRRLVRCELCKLRLIGERQRGHVYYRCHQASCPVTGVREETISGRIGLYFGTFDLSEPEVEEMRELSFGVETQVREANKAKEQALRLNLETVKTRLERLTDAYLDQAIDAELFKAKREDLLFQQRKLEEQQTAGSLPEGHFTRYVEDYLERARALSLSYGTGNPLEKRQILKTVTSNIFASRENVVVELFSPFQEILFAQALSPGADSDEGAQAFRFDGAQGSEMMSPMARCLAGV